MVREAIRILVIRPWTEPLAELRGAFEAAGWCVQLQRVDIEPALNAALERGGVDVVLLDPDTPGVRREVVEARVRDHGRAVPIVSLAPVADVTCRIEAALRARTN